jgi:hypothetical protein
VSYLRLAKSLYVVHVYLLCSLKNDGPFQYLLLALFMAINGCLVLIKAIDSEIAINGCLWLLMAVWC